MYLSPGLGAGMKGSSVGSMARLRLIMGFMA